MIYLYGMMKCKRIFFVLFLFSTIAVHGQLADDFFDELVSDDFTLPVGMTFDPDNRMIVWEKNGYVHQFDSSSADQSNVILDLHERVGFWGDHGMLGLALDPNYEQNRYIYVAYVMDRHYLFHYGKDTYDPDSTIKKQATIARVSRFTNNADFNYVDPDTELVLIGKTIEDAIPIIADFHGIGSLFFGTDGSLMVTTGDGGNDDISDNEENNFHSGQALEDGIITEKELVGPFRSQLVDNLNGKVLRFNPETGEGYPSNPFYDEENPNADRSKVFMIGLRNPYAAFLLPESGSHNLEDANPGTIISGDVGASTWEELNVIDQAGMNYGWPIYEGFGRLWDAQYNIEYENLDAPNTVLGNCDQPYFFFQDLIVNKNRDEDYSFENPCDNNVIIPDDIPTFVHHPPIICWNNAMWNPPARTMVEDFKTLSGELTEEDAIDAGIIEEGFNGHSSIPGFFYTEGNMPEEYNNSIFVCDNLGWIRAFQVDENWNVTGVKDIHSSVKGIVRMIYHEEEQAIYYLNIEQKEVRKVMYGGNPKPIAIASSDVQYGNSPLTVQFKGSESFDPKNEPISYFWDFGNGMTSTDVNPEMDFISDNEAPKRFDVSLTITDSIGQTNTADLVISVNNLPPEVKILGAADGDLYPISSLTVLPLESDVVDEESGSEGISYSWELFLHHNLHFHLEEPETNPNFTALIDPIGCNGENYWYRIRLTVEDSYGLKATDEIQIFPNCNDPFGEVEWVSTKVKENTIELSWTRDEADVKEMELERFDAFGNYNKLSIQDFIDAATTYEGIDINPVTGENIYRIKSILNNGEYDYSSFYSVRFPFNPVISVFPNPVYEALALYIQSSIWEDIQVKIFNVNGILVKESIFPRDQFEGEVIIPVEGFLPGVYYMTLNINGSKYVELFVVGK